MLLINTEYLKIRGWRRALQRRKGARAKEAEGGKGARAKEAEGGLG